jgi:hypothetical protein
VSSGHHKGYKPGKRVLNLTIQPEFTSEGILKMGIVPGLEALRDHLEKVTISYAQKMCHMGERLAGASYLRACVVLSTAPSTVITAQELKKLEGMWYNLFMLAREPSYQISRLTVDIDETLTFLAILEERAARRWVQSGR